MCWRQTCSCQEFDSNQKPSQCPSQLKDSSENIEDFPGAQLKTNAQPQIWQLYPSWTGGDWFSKCVAVFFQTQFYDTPFCSPLKPSSLWYTGQHAGQFWLDLLSNLWKETPFGVECMLGDAQEQGLVQKTCKECFVHILKHMVKPYNKVGNSAGGFTVSSNFWHACSKRSKFFELANVFWKIGLYSKTKHISSKSRAHKMNRSCIFLLSSLDKATCSLAASSSLKRAVKFWYGLLQIQGFVCPSFNKFLRDCFCRNVLWWHNFRTTIFLNPVIKCFRIQLPIGWNVRRPNIPSSFETLQLRPFSTRLSTSKRIYK